MGTSQSKLSAITHGQSQPWILGQNVLTHSFVMAVLPKVQTGLQIP